MPSAGGEGANGTIAARARRARIGAGRAARAEFQIDERSRKFLREVGSIVLGVLIALAIGEVADAIRHRVDARRALAAVRTDMNDNSSYDQFAIAVRYMPFNGVPTSREQTWRNVLASPLCRPLQVAG